MPLVYACISPHGGEVIPALSGEKSALYSPTTKEMRTLAVQGELISFQVPTYYGMLCAGYRLVRR
jgi:hypothetical protein